MTLTHSPLDAGKLSPAAQKALGPGPGKMMASRGMMPLPPADQVAVLYQLAFDGDQAIAGAARTTAQGLPEKLLAGTLTDARIDPRILDFFASMVGDKPSAFDAIAMNPASADETIATLATRGGPRETDMIAGNEQRLLRYPEIIAALYMNKRARMSTVDRAVELAVRNSVRVPGLACWDEVARALQAATPAASQEADDLFAYAATIEGGDSDLTASPLLGPDGEPEELLELEQPQQSADDDIANMSPAAKIRLATIGNAHQRAKMIRDPDRKIALAAIKAPAVTDIEAERWASNPALSEDVIRYIAGRREWTKLYGIKLALCRNPKTPVAESSRLITGLRDRDIANLSRNKSVPSAVNAQARKLMMARGKKE